MPAAKITKSNGKAYTLNAFPAVLGRGATCSVPIGGKGVSRQHAKIDYDAQNDLFEVSDLESLNGIKVNGNQVISAVLEPGDKISLGDVELVFQRLSASDQESLRPVADNDENSADDFAELEKMFEAEGSADNQANSGNLKVTQAPATQEQLDNTSQKNKSQPVLIATLVLIVMILLSAAVFIGYQIYLTTGGDPVVPADSLDELKNIEQQDAEQDPLKNATAGAANEGAYFGTAEVDASLADDYARELDQNKGTLNDNNTNAPLSNTVNAKSDDASSLDSTKGASDSQTFFDATTLGGAQASYVLGKGPMKPLISTEFLELPPRSVADIRSLKNGVGIARPKSKIPRFLTVDDLPSEPTSGPIIPGNNKSASRPASKQRKRPRSNKVSASASPSKSAGQLETEIDSLLKNAVKRYKDGYGRKVLAELEKASANQHHLSSARIAGLQAMLEKIKALVSKYYAGDKAYKARNKKAAFSAWAHFMKYEKEQLGDNKSYYAKLVNQFVVKEYFERAEAALEQDNNYHVAYQFWIKAAKIDASGEAEKKIVQLQEQANRLYENGLKIERTNIKSAIQMWQQVLRLIPPGDELHSKASGKISWYQNRQKK